MNFCETELLWDRAHVNGAVVNRTISTISSCFDIICFKHCSYLFQIAFISKL